MFLRHTVWCCGITLIILLAPSARASALTHTTVRTAVLRIGEVPRYFTSTATHLYTSYSDRLTVRIQGPFGAVQDACFSPSITLGTYQQGMIQSFGTTSRRLPTLQICSYLYKSASMAHGVYRYQIREAKADASTFSSQKTASHVGDESTAYSGQRQEELLLRSGNVVIDLRYTELQRVRMPPTAFLALGTILVSRLH